MEAWALCAGLPACIGWRLRDAGGSAISLPRPLCAGTGLALVLGQPLWSAGAVTLPDA